MQENDDITNRNSQVLTSLVNSNTGDSSIAKTVCNLLNTQTQFELEPVERNSFTINPTNPQQVLIKGQLSLSRMVPHII